VEIWYWPDRWNRNNGWRRGRLGRLDRERYLLVSPQPTRNHKRNNAMFKIGDLVQINSSYEDSRPPNLGIVVSKRRSDSLILDIAWYRVWIWGNFVEFVEEELELAVEFAKEKNKSRRPSKGDK